jgi:mono/diheme cytochrome c family protein
MLFSQGARLAVIAASTFAIISSLLFADEPDSPAPPKTASVETETDALEKQPSLAELKATGLDRSRFKDFATRENHRPENPEGTVSPQANLDEFRSTIQPILEQNCIDCHGPYTTEGNLRLDTLDPDLLSGPDTEWWSEVFAVLSKGEMPPPDYGQLEEADQLRMIDWLTDELQAASILRRNSGQHSTFRRMTSYEYNYALQDLLGLPWDFAKDLPPEPHSEDGFQNTSDLLHLSVTQFETFHRIARSALERATVSGERPPTRYWGVTMQQAADREWPKQDEALEKAKVQFKDDPDKLNAELTRLKESFQQPHRTAYFKELDSGRTAAAQWQYYGAKYAFAPTDELPELPDDIHCVAILPAGKQQKLLVELGNQLPDDGTMRVTVRASRVDTNVDRFPSLQLLFGWQASNEGRALLRVSQSDSPITANPDQPQLIEWDIPLGEIYPRNSVRKTSPMGAMPSPSEYIRLANSSASPDAIQIDFVRVAAPVYDQWPPASHQRIFFDSEHADDELTYAREIVTEFMTKAWRRPLEENEIDRKLDLFANIRSQCDTFEEAVVEVLATVLSSPQFLYIANDVAPPATKNLTTETSARSVLTAHALANRLSMFLWCSVPDSELLALAQQGRLAEPDVLAAQVDRMLADSRSRRFSKHFVHQWLDMQLLDFTNFQQNINRFDPLLKEAMQQEPIALFDEMLHANESVLDFIHSNYAMVNERLARHYGFPDVFGNQFRRIPLNDNFRRGGLLTQAGLLAMNSDWPDSHPLKRAVWVLESLLADPPPPPPPAVPQIDLADPEIAKMTLKERIEDHRNHAACMSCHARIDPWGIAFENYDALGQWRDTVQGSPVDASSELFNQQTIDGMDGLKRFLLEDRQDQFARAMVYKIATYGLGRRLGFADEADVDAITAAVRSQGDGLKTVVREIATSELFQTR